MAIGEALPHAVFVAEVIFVGDVHEPWGPGVSEGGVQVVGDLVSEARTDEEAVEVGHVVADTGLYLKSSEPVFV